MKKIPLSRKAGESLRKFNASLFVTLGSLVAVDADLLQHSVQHGGSIFFGGVEDEDHFTVRTDVVVSPQFFAWVLGFGAEAQIVAPDHVVAAMKKHAYAAAELYGEKDT